MNDAPHAELARIRDLIKKEQYDEALQSVIGVQQSVEGSAGALAFWLRGLALTGLSQPDRAERSFRTAYSIVRYAPASDADAQRILGEAAERIGLYSEATAAYQAVLQSLPNDEAAKAGLERLSRDRTRKSS